MTKLDPTPHADGRFGAPMGRASSSHYFDKNGDKVEITVTKDAPYPMHLVRCPLDSGGYDQGGAYWGLGEPLYYYEAHLTDIRGYVRAATREKAKEAVKTVHEHARFYR